MDDGDAVARRLKNDVVVFYSLDCFYYLVFVSCKFCFVVLKNVEFKIVM